MQRKKMVFDARMQGTKTLAQDGNRLRLAMAMLLLLVAVLLYSILQYTCSMLADALRQAVGEWLAILIVDACQLICLAITLFFTAPAVIGFYDLAGRMSRGEDTVLADLFSPFSERKRYARALALSWSVFWRIGLAVFVMLITDATYTTFSNGAWGWFLLTTAILVAEGILCVCSLLRLFWMPYLVLEEGLSPRLARRESRMLRRRAKGAARAFRKTWFWWIVLGFLTVGVLLLWEVLPRMAVSYFHYCREARNEEEKTIRTEDYR